VAKVPARGALDVGQSDLFAKLKELLSRVQHEFDLGNERFSVEADAPVERDQIAIEVIYHLYVASRFGKQHGETSGERLAVAGVFWDSGKDVL